MSSKRTWKCSKDNLDRRHRHGPVLAAGHPECAAPDAVARFPGCGRPCTAHLTALRIPAPAGRRLRRMNILLALIPISLGLLGLGLLSLGQLGLLGFSFGSHYCLSLFLQNIREEASRCPDS